jgi:hypothetical protein
LKYLIPFLFLFFFPAIASAASGDETKPPSGEISKLQSEAERGITGSQYWLGMKYLNGDGVARDDVQAAKWLRKTIGNKDGDDIYAKIELCKMFLLHKTNDPHDEIFCRDSMKRDAQNDQILKYAYKLAAQGDMEAEYYLCESSPADSDRIWCQKAADQGSGSAQMLLVNLYAQGKLKPPPPSLMDYIRYLTRFLLGLVPVGLVAYILRENGIKIFLAHRKLAIGVISLLYPFAAYWVVEAYLRRPIDIVFDGYFERSGAILFLYFFEFILPGVAVLFWLPINPPKKLILWAACLGTVYSIAMGYALGAFAILTMCFFSICN